MSYNPFTPATEEQTNRRERRARIRYLSDLKMVLQTYEGRRVLWDLMAFSGVTRLSYTGEAFSTAFNEGGRNVGNIMLGNIFEANTDLYFTAMKEAQERESTATSKIPEKEDQDG